MLKKVFFNGSESKKSLDQIQDCVDLSGKFSGSINIKKIAPTFDSTDHSYIFSNVNSSNFDYYLSIFKQETSNLKNKEVTFEIQTNDAITATI